MGTGSLTRGRHNQSADPMDRSPHTGPGLGRVSLLPGTWEGTLEGLLLTLPPGPTQRNMAEGGQSARGHRTDDAQQSGGSHPDWCFPAQQHPQLQARKAWAWTPPLGPEHDPGGQ